MKNCLKTVLFIGDSITDVAFNRRTRHLKARCPYPLQVKNALDKRTYRCVFKGIASNRSYDVYDRLTRDCIAFDPDYVVLMIGVNDAWQRYVPEAYPPLKRPLAPHFREILRRFRAELKPETQVLILLPFMLNTVTEKLPFRAVLEEDIATERALAAEYGFETVDLLGLFDAAQNSAAPATLATDGIHPTTEGHAIIARAVMRALFGA